jgi:TatD DNase family protein
MTIDSHAHLEMREFDRDRDDVVARAKKAGITHIVTVGTTLKECQKAVSLAEHYEGVFAAVGIHPHEVKGVNEKTYAAVKELAKSSKVVAYGEIGLDFFRNYSPRELQIRSFGEQLDIAKELDLPVIIHDRDAHEQTVRILREWKGRKGGVIHCFSGDTAMAQKCLDMGFYISVPGPVTYPNAKKITDVVRNVPLDRLLVETDCPYLTPVPNRGKRNEPAYVVHTVQKVAEIRGMPWEEIGRVTSDNAKNVFGIK